MESKFEKPEEYVKSNFDVLCNVRFFAQFTEDHQRQLFSQLKVQKFKDGDLIVEQGTIGRSSHADIGLGQQCCLKLLGSLDYALAHMLMQSL